MPYWNSTALVRSAFLEDHVKTIATIAAAAVLFCAPISAAVAVDIVNDDGVPYDVHVSEGGDTVVVSIKLGATVNNVCEYCIVEMDGAEPVSAEDTEIVRIREGILIKE